MISSVPFIHSHLLNTSYTVLYSTVHTDTGVNTYIEYKPKPGLPFHASSFPDPDQEKKKKKKRPERKVLKGRYKWSRHQIGSYRVNIHTISHMSYRAGSCRSDHIRPDQTRPDHAMMQPKEGIIKCPSTQISLHVSHRIQPIYINPPSPRTRPLPASTLPLPLLLLLPAESPRTPRPPPVPPLRPARRQPLSLRR